MTSRRRRRGVELEQDENGAYFCNALLALVAVGLRAAIRDARAGGSALPPDLARVLAAAQVGEQRFRSRVVPSGERVFDPAGSAASPSVAGDYSFTTDDVARLAGISPRAVTKAAALGRLAGRRVGGRWVFTEGAVKAWTANRRRNEDGDQEQTGRRRAGTQGRDGRG